jgi:SAM-dependent methyltransferase
MYDDAQKRFDFHRSSFASNPALKRLYARWYGMVRDRLPDPGLGPWVELGSGPGLVTEFIPEVVTTDLVPAPWLGLRSSAECLPFRSGSVGALLLFDVLHHLPNPSRLFDEANRVLAPGGRLVMCEPLVSALSYPIYRFFHEEALEFTSSPWETVASAEHPFDGNQAVPTALLLRGRAELDRRWPGLSLTELLRFAGPAYPATGGFGKKPMLPMRIWEALDAIETRLPSFVFRLIGFRMLAVLSRLSVSTPNIDKATHE